MVGASLPDDLLDINFLAEPGIELADTNLDFRAKRGEGLNPLQQLPAELLLGRFARERQRLTQVLGRAPTTEEIAAALGTSVEQVEELEEIRRPPLSLDRPVDDGGHLLRDVVPDRDADPAAVLARLFRERADLISVLDDLAANERTVLRRRFGLEGDPPETLEAIGTRLKLTRERVRQIEAAGLRKLRALLAARGLDADTLG